MSSGNTASGLPSKPSTAVRNIAVSFEGQLDDGELLTGTPTVTVAPSGPTITLEATNSVGKTINNRKVPPRKAVTFSVSGGTNGTDYTFTVQCGTTASQTLIGYTKLRVQNK